MNPLSRLLAVDGLAVDMLAVDFFEQPAVVAVLLIMAAAAGAGVRFLAGRQLNNAFPTGTLVVNLVASLALGIITAAPDPVPAILGIGMLGALSTWSTAAVEAAALARDGEGLMAAGYVGLTVTGGIVAAWVGLTLGSALL